MPRRSRSAVPSSVGQSTTSMRRWRSPSPLWRLLRGTYMAGLFDPKSRRYTMPPLSSFRTLAGGYNAAIKRKAYFAFHYDDIMRVNNVRNAWKITHPDSPTNRSFQDSSLWESNKLEGEEAIKRLIREGVEYTSAVCVLIGS